MEPVLITFYELLMAVGVKKFCVSSTQWSKVPVDAVVADVVTVLTVLSVAVVGVDAVDCDSVVKVVGVLALSRTHTYAHLEHSQRCIIPNVLSLRVVEGVSFIWLNLIAV